MCLLRSICRTQGAVGGLPDDYSAVKMSRNKVLGTAQQLSELKANTWADVDVGESQAWKGLIIKTGE